MSYEIFNITQLSIAAIAVILIIISRQASSSKRRNDISFISVPLVICLIVLPTLYIGQTNIIELEGHEYVLTGDVSKNQINHYHSCKHELHVKDE